MGRNRPRVNVPRFAIGEAELSKLLRKFAPDKGARVRLEQLILNVQAALHRGLPLLERATKAERLARVDQLKVLDKALQVSAKALNERSGSKMQTLGNILGAEIARSATEEAFRLAGVVVALSSRDVEFIRARSREPEIEVTAEAQRHRASRGLQSPVVLAELLTRCRAIIAAQLTVERSVKGGRPSFPEREYVLTSLALSFSDIFGVTPTPTDTVTFVKLSGEVLELFGLETHGAEYAAVRILARVKRAPASRSKPKN